jgi:uncharacterized membrane protein
MAGDEEIPSDRSSGGGRRRRAHALSCDDLGRILALSDGVFAFAMTLLVLSLAVPSFGVNVTPTEGQLAHALLTDWTVFLGYVFAFVMIGVWWVAHHRTFQYIQRFDGELIWINMAILLQIAVMPFILQVYSTFSYRAVAVDLFAGIQIALGVSMTGLWEYARYRHLTKPDIPEATARYFTRRSLFAAAVFAVSIGISFIDVTAAQLSWLAIFAVQRVLAHFGE